MKYLIAMLLIAGCGKDCTPTIQPTEKKTFGTLEEVKCGAGQVLISVTPNYIAGGIVTHLIASCGKVVMSCP